MKSKWDCFDECDRKWSEIASMSAPRSWKWDCSVRLRKCKYMSATALQMIFEVVLPQTTKDVLDDLCVSPQFSHRVLSEFSQFCFLVQRLSPHNQVTHSSAFRKSHYFVHFLCSLSAVEHNQFIHRARSWFSYSISSSSSKSGYLARLCSYLVILFFHFPQKICSKKLQYLSASSAQQNYSSSAGLGRCSYFVILLSHFLQRTSATNLFPECWINTTYFVILLFNFGQQVTLLILLFCSFIFFKEFPLFECFGVPTILFVECWIRCSYLMILLFHSPQRICVIWVLYQNNIIHRVLAQTIYSSSAGSAVRRCSHFVILFFTFFFFWRVLPYIGTTLFTLCDFVILFKEFHYLSAGEPL